MKYHIFVEKIHCLKKSFFLIARMFGQKNVSRPEKETKTNNNILEECGTKSVFMIFPTFMKNITKYLFAGIRNRKFH